MKLVNGIKTRRSIRKYKDIAINEKLIRKILELAIMAPSAHNSNPWYFLVIIDNQIKRNLANNMAKKYEMDLKKDGLKIEIIKQLVNESIEKFSHAPVLIIPCLDMKRMQKYPDERRQIIEHQMGVQSVSASIQNLLLAAHNEGLGSCWYCAPLFAQNIVRDTLGIPKDIEPQAFITIGYPLMDKPKKIPPRLPLEEICFINKWGEKY
ncbi:MAG: nitroreductase family protein [Candidatus Helarchaeota archaeon]